MKNTAGNHDQSTNFSPGRKGAVVILIWGLPLVQKLKEEKRCRSGDFTGRVLQTGGREPRGKKKKKEQTKQKNKKENGTTRTTLIFGERTPSPKFRPQRTRDIRPSGVSSALCRLWGGKGEIYTNSTILLSEKRKGTPRSLKQRHSRRMQTEYLWGGGIPSCL